MSDAQATPIYIWHCQDVGKVEPPFSLAATRVEVKEASGRVVFYIGMEEVANYHNLDYRRGDATSLTA